MMRRVRIVCVVLVAMMFAACGGGSRPVDRRSAPPAAATVSFTELSPDVYEPCGVTSAPGALWVLGCQGNAVRVPMGNGARTSRTVSSDIVGLDALAGNGSDAVWALVAEGRGRSRRGSVLRLNPSSGEPVSTVRLGSSIPAHAVVAAGTLWVAAVDGRLYSVDGSTPRQISAGAPLMWVLADAGRLFTVAEKGDVIQRDIAGRAQRTFEGVTLNPIGAAAGAGAVWLASSSRGLVRLDPATGRVTSVRVTGTVNDIEPCGGMVWLSQPDFGLRSLDATGAVVREVRLSVAPRYLLCSAARLWIVSEDGRLGSIDATP